VTFDPLTITGGFVTGDGGGIRIGGSTASIVELNETTVTDNEASTGGGGASVDSGNASTRLRMMRSTVSSNRAANGGGVATTEFQDVEVTASTVSGNQATVSGGGFHTGGDALTRTNPKIPRHLRG
jgi:fibronectin-binding autotransporter adhesin